MYLPLTGFKSDKEKEYEMSINSIGSSFNNSYAIKPIDESVGVKQEVKKLADNVIPPDNDNKHSVESNNEKNFRSSAVILDGGLNTQDFLALHAQTKEKEDPYAILDEVIQRMKENIEKAGEAISAIKEMSKACSQSELTLDLLQKTFEALEKLEKTNGGGNLFGETR
jgi:ribosome-associated translation inhibitor RaiA